MAVRINKPWRDLTAKNLRAVAGHLGVYQLADARDEIVYIGVADARSLFGLKGELAKALENPPNDAVKFRVEVNMSYRTRHAELLGAYQHDFGQLPRANIDIDRRTLGRLRPGGGPS